MEKSDSSEWVVVRRDPDVVTARPRGEWMLGRIDTPAVGPVPEEVGHLVRERPLALGREISLQEGGVDVPMAQLGDQLDDRRGFSSSNSVRTSAVVICGS